MSSFDRSCSIPSNDALPKEEVLARKSYAQQITNIFLIFFFNNSISTHYKMIIGHKTIFHSMSLVSTNDCRNKLIYDV